MKLLEDWVTVLPQPEAEKVGSVYVPNKKLQMIVGLVREAGPGKVGVPATVQPDQRVLYFRTGATEMEGSDLVLMRESNIIGVL